MDAFLCLKEDNYEYHLTSLLIIGRFTYGMALLDYT